MKLERISQIFKSISTARLIASSKISYKIFLLNMFNDKVNYES
jgi:hypothetical protein